MRSNFINPCGEYLKDLLKEEGEGTHNLKIFLSSSSLSPPLMPGVPLDGSGVAAAK